MVWLFVVTYLLLDIFATRFSMSSGVCADDSVFFDGAGLCVDIIVFGAENAVFELGEL